MATVTGLTAERMLEIEDNSIVGGEVVGGNLILTKHDGSTIDAGPVVGVIPVPVSDDLILVSDLAEINDLEWRTALKAKGAFKARRTATQSIPSSTNAVVQLNVEDIDVSSWYDPATYRYTPQIPGLYRFSCAVEWSASSAAATGFQIYKNGVLDSFINFSPATAAASGPLNSGSILISMNGTTDYIDLRCTNYDGASARNIASARLDGELIGTL